jgi:hypothetical protein
VSNRFAAYKDLLSFTSLEQGKWWKQQEMRYRKRAAEQLLVVSWRQERFNQLLDFFKAQKENSIQAIDAAVKLEAIRVEVWLSQWDANLLTWWDIDVMNNNIPETPWESA